MNDIKQLSDQFASILKGKVKLKQNGASVSLKRSFNVFVQGRQSQTILPVGLSFESLDQQGRSLNLGEIAVLESEIPQFVKSVSEQGLTVSAVHNHWINLQPFVMYVHVQSVEPPLDFAQKLANAFSTLSSPPIQDQG